MSSCDKANNSLYCVSFINQLQLEVQSKKMESNRVMYEKELERQVQLLDVRAAKINSLEGIYLFRLTLQLILLRKQFTFVCSVYIQKHLV